MVTQLSCILLGIHTFKHFLESIAYGQDGPLQSARKDVLLEYLNSQPVFPSGQDSTYAFDLVKTWSFAAQCNNEALFAAVAAVLALLLKTLSFHIESREYGRNVCHLLLQNDHIKLFERGLSAQKTKDHLISACLRLLTEIVLFDGGSSAKRLYRLKDITFKRLDTFLSLRQDVKPAAVSSSRRKPSIRNLALRYLFANLRLQDHAIKIEILGNGRILRSVFQDLKTDAPPIVREILDVAEDDILKDDKIPRRVKGRLFTDQVLASIATLYGYRHHDDPMQDAVLDTPPENISASAHALLLSICTKPEYGVLIGHEKRDPAAEGDGDDVPNIPDHEAAGLLHKHTSRPKTIKNHTLSSFLQTLRPYANDMQRSLTLATFRAAPELLADYFRKMKTFSFDPKLTATWVGFAAFLLATISLPIEERMVNPDGQGLLAPSIADIIESILPMPLSPKAVSRCLSQNSKLVKFFAIKTLSAAFHKFSQHLGRFRSSRRTAGNNHHDDVWVSAASSLTEEFSQRCPDMSHVITVFRSCTPQEDVLREASARLLSLYYQHLPQTALEQKFDASTALTAAFKMAMSTTQPEERPTLEPVVLEHLIVVAECSPDIRWWQKSRTSSESSVDV